MSGLNLPSFDLKIKKQNNKNYVFDRLRKQFTRLTPEEYVRQHFINYLIEYKNYSEALMANEVVIEVGNMKKRCDTVLYDKFLNPVLIVEYKSPAVKITQETFDQIVVYNTTLRVPWLMVSNGLEHFCCRIDYETGSYGFQPQIPYYDELF
ncbi:MAG: type I restriction enzyme HsdR N-terminal domain-containing protein [Candidatus Azobacteroides sp.]|nr:type I restriction enzyme HsdR N-terminal domain-containing protein [Candidatus Azobacteroides sp.]